MPQEADRIDWPTIERWSRRLARDLPRACGVEAFDRVIGVSRGGLVPAVLLAGELGVKRLETVQVRLYVGATKLDAPELIGPRPAPAGPSGEPSRTLVVDEMLDSGSTLAFLAGLLPGVHMATLVARARASGAAERDALRAVPCGDPSQGRHVWVAETLATERWVLFPWSPPEDRAAVAAGA